MRALAVHELPGTSLAHPAGEVQALLAEWIFLTEAAFTALDHEDPDGVAEAVRGRNELMPLIEVAMRSLPAAESAGLPFARIRADVQAAEGRLVERMQSHLAELREQLQPEEAPGAAASAYRRLDNRPARALNVRG